MGRLNSNACGMRSQEDTGCIPFVGICRVHFRIPKPTQSFTESARNIQPFMGRDQNPNQVPADSVSPKQAEHEYGWWFHPWASIQWSCFRLPNERVPACS